MGLANAMHIVSDGTPGGTHIYDEAGNDISAYFVGAHVLLRADYPRASADLYVAPAVIRTVDMQLPISSATYRCGACGNPISPGAFAGLDERARDEQGERARTDALEGGEDDPL